MIVIRASTLPMYADCPRRTAAGLYKDEIKDAGFKTNRRSFGAAAAVGIGTHAGAAFIMEQKYRTGERGDLNDATEISIQQYQDDAKNGLDYDAKTPNDNDAEKQLQTLTRSYYYEVEPLMDLDDPAIEEKLFAKGDGFELRGSPDLADTYFIEDIKTGMEGHFHAQFGAYSLLRKSHGFPMPKKIFVDYLPRVPIGKPYPGHKRITLDTTLCETIATNILDTMKRDINNFIESSGNEWAFPCNPKSMLCSPKYCNAYNSDFCFIKGGSDD